jgi:type IV secretion system protein VirD4|tara:strand:- start:474 stop:2057 length:1584 start_codon:yes stop_codon:yes gene_type:complete
MFGRRKRRMALDNGMLSTLKRGADPNAPALAAQEAFPTAEMIAADHNLAFDMSNAEGKMFLGLVGGEMKIKDGTLAAHGGHLVGIHDDRHFMIVAGSRAGKGRSILLPLLATWPGSVIVIDPKMDLATETASLRAKHQRVLIHDAFGAAGPSCDPYRASGNPLSYRLGDDDDSLLDLAMLIADGLVVKSRSNEPHWDESAMMFIEGVILHVMTSPIYDGRRTLPTVHKLLIEAVEDGGNEKGELSTLEKEMCDNEAVGGAVQAAAIAFYDRHERERASVLSTLRRHLHFLTFPRIRNSLVDGAVDVRTFHETPTSLYIGLPATKMRTCAGLLRLFINLALAAFEANSARHDFQHQSGRYPCLLIMDEFFSLGRMERIEAAAGQVAGFGVKLCPVLQDLSQLKAMYPDSWETFAANCGAISFFGNTDLTTLEFLEKRLGQTQVRSASQSEVSYDGAVKEGATGSSYSINSHPLMSVPELARTFNRDDPYCRQLVLSAKHGPLIIQRAYYDQHAQFRKLFPCLPLAQTR